jgi:beta-galactosidase
VNTFLAIMGNPAIQEMMKKKISAGETKEDSQKQADINETMAGQSSLFGGTMDMPELTKMAEDSFAAVDIAGYNYLSMRYEPDGKLYPNRIICGTETFARGIDQNWRFVLDNSCIIGDFAWAGWDYLGEAGIGKIDYGENPEPGYHFYGDYPWILAWCGDIDITGRRRPSSYYREIVFGLRKEPYIAVQRPERLGTKVILSPWSWSDTVAGWTWTGDEGKPIKVEVYSNADEVELLLNGKSLGEKSTGEKNRFKAEFDTVYQSGKLEAVAYSGGKEQGRSVLESATGDVILDVRVDRETINANDRDLAFVEIALTGSRGGIWHRLRKKVSIVVEGAGELQGFGSAEPNSEEGYSDVVRSAFDGYVLAVIRPKGTGNIHVIVSADGCESVTRNITAV